jgi:hypothetical protein
MTVEMAGGKEDGEGKGEEIEGNIDVVIERRVRRIIEEKFRRGRRRGLNTPHRPLGPVGDKPPLWRPPDLQTLT